MTPTTTLVGTRLKADFTRDWAGDSITPALTNGPLRLIFGRHKSIAAFGTAHSDRVAFAAEVNFFTSPAYIAPPTPVPMGERHTLA